MTLPQVRSGPSVHEVGGEGDLVGMIAYGLIVRRIEPVDWHTPGLDGLVPVLTRQE